MPLDEQWGITLRRNTDKGNYERAQVKSMQCPLNHMDHNPRRNQVPSSATNCWVGVKRTWKTIKQGTVQECMDQMKILNTWRTFLFWHTFKIYGMWLGENGETFYDTICECKKVGGRHFSQHFCQKKKSSGALWGCSCYVRKFTNSVLPELSVEIKLGACNITPKAKS